jgi:hypothetical protein
MLLLADTKDDINRWLDQNPMVLGGGALLLGLVLVGVGAKALLTGEAVSKRGHKLTGAQAKMLGGVQAGFGALVILFGLYKMLAG